VNEAGDDDGLDWEGSETLSLATRLRTLAFERSKGKRKRVTQNDLLIEAIERFLNAEGI
jgi:hypothetical protein